MSHVRNRVLCFVIAVLMSSLSFADDSPGDLRFNGNQLQEFREGFADEGEVPKWEDYTLADLETLLTRPGEEKKLLLGRIQSMLDKIEPDKIEILEKGFNHLLASYNHQFWSDNPLTREMIGSALSEVKDSHKSFNPKKLKEVEQLIFFLKEGKEEIGKLSSKFCESAGIGKTGLKIEMSLPDKKLPGLKYGVTFNSMFLKNDSYGKWVVDEVLMGRILAFYPKALKDKLIGELIKKMSSSTAAAAITAKKEEIANQYLVEKVLVAIHQFIYRNHGKKLPIRVLVTENYLLNGIMKLEVCTEKDYKAMIESLDVLHNSEHDRKEDRMSQMSAVGKMTCNHGLLQHD